MAILFKQDKTKRVVFGQIDEILDRPNLKYLEDTLSSIINQTDDENIYYVIDARRLKEIRCTPKELIELVPSIRSPHLKAIILYGYPEKLKMVMAVFRFILEAYGHLKLILVRNRKQALSQIGDEDHNAYNEEYIPHTSRELLKEIGKA